MKKVFVAVYYVVVAALAYWITIVEGPKIEVAALQQVFAVSLSCALVAGCIVIERVFAVKEQ